MKHIFVPRFYLCWLVLMALPLCLRAEGEACAQNGGDPRTPLDGITFAYSEATGTVTGFSENPGHVSTPRKKYLRATFSGTAKLRVAYPGYYPNIYLFTESYGAQSLVDPNTGNITPAGKSGIAEDIYLGQPWYSSPDPYRARLVCDEWAAFDAVRWNIYYQSSTQAFRTPRANDYLPCGREAATITPDHWLYAYTDLQAIDQVTETLSDEDTPDDALKRAQTLADAALVNPVYGAFREPFYAYKTSLDPSDLKVKVSHVAYKAQFMVDCPGDYDIHLTYSEKPRPPKTGPIVPPRVVVERRYFESGARTVEGKIQIENEDTDYWITAITLEKPSCGGDRKPGEADIHISSIHVGLGLGQTTASTSAGELRLHSDTISAAVYTPAALVPIAPLGGSVELVRDSSDAVRQAKAPQSLADIVTLDASSYEVRFYNPADVGTQNATTKIYALSGTPFVTYRFENPDAALSLTTRLRITETRGSNVRVSEYAYDAASTTWSLSKGNGLRKEILAITTAGADTTKTTTIRDENNVVISKSSKIYRTFAWGDELVSAVLDPGNAALTTSYEFYNNSSTDGSNYKRLKLRTNSDGSWERFTYDSSYRTLKSIRPYLNAVSIAAENLCRVTENSYTDLADADGDTKVEKLTTTIESTLGVETGRSYRVDWSKQVTLGTDVCNRRTDIHCVAAGAAWDASANLVSETLVFTADPYIGRTRRTVNPDGTATLTSYTVDANNQQTTIVKSGQPNATFDDIVAGTRTTTLTSAQGQVTSESTTDIASNLALSAWAATQFDALGRPTRLDYADGTYTTRDYACCGLASTRDRAGLVTTYQYNDLGQQTDATSNGITTHTTHDADGRIKAVSRIGSDASSMPQASYVYDLAGRMTESRDALNRLTTTSETFDSLTGQTTRTTTTPSGTSINVRARDGASLSQSGTAVAPRVFEYGNDASGQFTKQYLGTSNAATEWSKSYTDFAGRFYKTVLADGATTQSYFNAIGQVVRQVDADGIATLFAYNASGEQEITALDVNANGLINFDGTDRITKSTSEIATKTVASTAYTVQRNTTQVWETDAEDTATTVSLSEQSADGLRSWQTMRGPSGLNLTTTSVTVLEGSGDRTVTTTGPDGVKNIQVYSGGLLTSSTVKTAADVQLAAVTYGYDSHHRLQSTTDARTGTTTYAYYGDDQIHTVTTPDPDTTRSGDGYDLQTTSYTYNAAGRVDTVTQPDTTVVNTTYYPTGAVKRTWGSRTYPTEYTYDPQGRVKTLTTWQDFTGDTGKAVTTWNYTPDRGLLLNKRYADNSGPSYTYKPSGRLETRTWARTPAVTTTYNYNAAGDLSGIDYSDTTPDISMTYDRLGRPKTRTDAAGLCTWGYDPATGQLKDEDYTAGPLNTLGVHRTFDSLNRLDSLSALSASSAFNSVSYNYDAASRLDTVTSGTRTATYGYVTNSPMVGTITFKQSGTTRLTTTKAYDNLNRLSGISSVPSASSAVSSSYSYNSANQRTKAVREDNAYWNYNYDALGQVTSGKKHFADTTPINGLDYAWTYDDIGNRKTSTTNSQISNYTANFLNQYSQHTVPGIVDVTGAAAATATVTVALNGGTPQPTTRQGELFFKQFTVDNSTAAQNPSLKITGVKNLVGASGEDAVTEVTKTSHVPKTPEVFTYDTDGNLTDDARWHYTWDAENRLVALQTVSAVATAFSSLNQRLEFTYDGQGRRISKNVYNWNGAAWVLGTSTRFLHDGWNLLAELNALNSNAVVSTYVWGLDLSGSAQGAGGVGGLLFSNFSLPSSTSYASAYDGNGNVIGLVDMATGTKSATYDYNAFGETIQSDGVASAANHFRFSTKYTDDETGLYYYGYRFYQPTNGRWLNRDPIEEGDGPNMYAFVSNQPTQQIDVLGQYGTMLAPRLSPFLRPTPVKPTHPLPMPVPIMGPNPQLGGHLKRYWKVQDEEMSDQNEWLFRSMRGDLSPELGESKRTLGVVTAPNPGPPNDVQVIGGEVTGPTDTNGKYQGMSVSPTTPYNLPDFRRPMDFEGTGPDQVWAIKRSSIHDPNLDIIDDKPPFHALIAPHKCMPYSDYKRSLESTRPFWRKVIIITVREPDYI